MGSGLKESEEMRDFTIDAYHLLLDAIQKADFKFLTYRDFKLQAPRKICLRHDVDARKENSYEFAKIQSKRNIRGTYYFRAIPQSFDEKLIVEMAEMGHEIGYHYETMDTSGGDVDKAYDAFCQNLERFRKIVNIETICMHGSPLSQFDNRDIWKKYDYKKLGLKAEPYFDMDFNKVFYLTDTGRRWDGNRVSIRDKAMDSSAVTNGDFLKRKYRSTFEIVANLGKKDFPVEVMMTFHPQRWSNNIYLWSREFLLQNLKNQVKRVMVRK